MADVIPSEVVMSERERRKGFASVPINLIAAPVSHRAFRVLCAVLAHADPAGSAHPSNARLARVSGVDKRDVVRCLRELEDAGLLRIAISGHQRRLVVREGERATIPLHVSDSGKSPTPPMGYLPPHLHVSDSGKSPTPPMGDLPPKQTIEQEECVSLTRAHTGADADAQAHARVRDAPPIADRVAAILGAVDPLDGAVDPHVAGLLSQWLHGKPERAVLAAAYEVMARHPPPRDPVRYYIRRLESPLPDPAAGSAIGGSHPRLTADQKRRSLGESLRERFSRAPETEADT